MSGDTFDNGKSGGAIHIEHGVETEADVEHKVIWPLLTGANFLEIPAASIKAKDYLRPVQLDKAAGRTRGITQISPSGRKRFRY